MYFANVVVGQEWMLKEGFKQSYKISVDTAAYCAKKSRHAPTENVFHPFQCTYVYNIFVHVKGIFDAQLWRTKLLQCTANNLSIQVVRWRSNLPPWWVFRVLTIAFAEAWAAPVRTINSQRYGWVNAMLWAESDHRPRCLHFTSKKTPVWTSTFPSDYRLRGYWTTRSKLAWTNSNTEKAADDKCRATLPIPAPKQCFCNAVEKF